MSAPDLKTFDWILVNSSSGKDSQTSLRQVVLEADRQGFPRDRIVVVHADLGEAEWAGVQELATRQADHYGLEIRVVERRQKDGSSDTILDYVERRGAWPSSTVRFCTSEFKRTPCRRVITELDRRVREDRSQAVRILQVFGFRAEESAARAKHKEVEADLRSSTKTREVINWHPILSWTEAEVWSDIHASGVPHHPAYDLGMPRLSCVLCVFASPEVLEIAGRANPELLEKYAETERRIGHTFRKDFSIAALADRLRAERRAA